MAATTEVVLDAVGETSVSGALPVLEKPTGPACTVEEEDGDAEADRDEIEAWERVSDSPVCDELGLNGTGTTVTVETNPVEPA